MMRNIQFGYLPKKISCQFEIGEFYPIENFDKNITKVSEICKSKEGFLFPPICRTHTKTIPNEDLVPKGPSFSPNIFRFFPTHILDYEDSGSELDDFKLNPVFFILQVIGYVSGYRLLPSEYWFDLRIPDLPTINLLSSDGSLSHVLNVGISEWKKWDHSKRIALANLLFIFNRNPCYQWGFEKFDFEYKIIDSCYKILNLDGKGGHGARLGNLLSHLEIRESLDNEMCKKIVSMRNELVHELKWGQDLIAGRSDKDLFWITSSLHRLNHRILGRMIGLSGEYFKSNPKSIFAYDFNVMKPAP